MKINKDIEKDIRNIVAKMNYGSVPRVDSLPIDVKKVIINDTTVIVHLMNGKQGIAKCGYMDTFDPYVGFVIAYYKASHNRNFELKKTFESCINSANKKGYKTAILKNHDKPIGGIVLWNDFHSCAR